jgi:hypothetical protein
MHAILIGALSALSAVSALAGQGQVEPAAGGETFEWPQIERQIEWHRDRSRACGPLSALFVLQQLGHQVNVSDTLQQFTPIDDDGVPLADVLSLCQKYEPRSRLVNIADKQWRQLVCPCILVVNDRHHSVVLQSYSTVRETAAVWDPAEMTVKTLPLEQLQATWSGEAILFTAFPWPSILVGTANTLMLSALLYGQWRKWQRHRRDRAAANGTNSARAHRRKHPPSDPAIK